MDETVIPSADRITEEQIKRILGPLASGLRKAGFARRPIQQIVEHELAGLTAQFVEMVRNLAVTKTFFQKIEFPVDVSANEIPGIADRRQHINPDVVKTMPRPCGATSVMFFNLNRPMKTDDELEKEYELRGPAIDPFTLGKANDENPTLSGKCPNATHWRDEDNNWCYMAFYEWGGERHVSIDRGTGWHPFWHFAAADK